MWPVIFQLGPIKVYSFGVLLFLGVILGLYVSWKKIRDYHIEDEEFLDVSLQTIFWGLVGARIAYIFEHFSVFGFNFLKWLWFTHYVGLSMWGAILGGLVGLILITKNRKVNLFEWLDIGSLGLVLGLSIGRLAALLNGSSVGIAVPMGISVNGIDGKVLPIQAAEVLVLVILFVVLWRLERSYRTISWYRAGKSYSKSGFLWFMSLIWVGVLFLATSFGYQKLNGNYEQLLNRAFAVLSFVVGVVGLYTRSGRNLRSDFGFLFRKNQKRAKAKLLN